MATLRLKDLFLVMTFFSSLALAQDIPPIDGAAEEVPPIDGTTEEAPPIDGTTADIPPTEGVAAEDPAHQELRNLKDSVMDAFNKRDMEKLVTAFDPNVVITWANGEVSRGPEGLMSYFKKMMEGPDKIVDEIRINPEVAELTIIHGGDTGIAWGTSDDYYKLTNGMELNVKGYWSTTLIKSESGWKIASFHSSMDAFDNGIIDKIKTTYVWVAVGMLIAGLAFGAFFMRLSMRR
jgi:ketosteroid isomerase-like protein